MLFVPLFVIAGAAVAEEQIDLEGARLFGNRDLPNITYVVPWKEERFEAIDVKPIGTLFDEALKPLDRDVFMREVEYYELLQEKPK
jgi:hypothetical protein